jgi:hypothetical protein
MSNNWIVIIFLLFAVLMMSLYLGSQNYNAFAFTKSTLSEYPYEGFATYQESFESREDEMDVEPAIAANPVTAVVKPATAVKPASKPVITAEGFETMPEQQVSTLSGSTYGDEKPVAFLYNNDANTTCKNYGYTNSKGFICMSASDIQLLTTRGGNAAGVSDQIGK